MLVQAVVARGRSFASVTEAKYFFEECGEKLREDEIAFVPRAFRIPFANVPAFEERVETLSKRATKLGLGVISAEAFGTYTDEAGFQVGVVFHVHVPDSGSRLSLGAWKVVAAVDHARDENGVAMNLIRSADGCPALPDYRRVESSCDHCRTNRRRNTTVVLVGEGGKLVRVGKSCMKDFTGVDAACALGVLELTASVVATLDEGFGGSYGASVFGVDVIVAEAVKTVKEHGWVSRTQARESYSDIQATADRVVLDLTWRRGSSGPCPKDPSAEDAALAAEVVSWAKGLEVDDGNDYLWNLHVAVKRGYVELGARGSTIGLVVSAYSAYLRARNEEIRRAQREAREKLPRGHFGKVGERYGAAKKGAPPAFEAEVARVRMTSGMYGDGTVVTLWLERDGTGYELVWFASGTGLGLEDGQRVLVTGTVKAHKDDPKWGPSTVLSRCELKKI